MDGFFMSAFMKSTVVPVWNLGHDYSINVSAESREISRQFLVPAIKNISKLGLHLHRKIQTSTNELSKILTRTKGIIWSKEVTHKMLNNYIRKYVDGSFGQPYINNLS